MSNFDFTMMIDWKEWRQWDEPENGGLAKLNRLLGHHGIRLVDTAEDGSDYLNLKVESVFTIEEVSHRVEFDLDRGLVNIIDCKIKPKPDRKEPR